MNDQQDLDAELEKLRRLAFKLDALFTIPGTRIKIGIDNLLGFLPVIGDLAALAPALWLVWRARKLGATQGAQAFMAINLTVDFVIGSIPIAGDVFDILYNANIRNYRLLEYNLARRAEQARTVATA